MLVILFWQEGSGPGLAATTDLLRFDQVNLGHSWPSFNLSRTAAQAQHALGTGRGQATNPGNLSHTPPVCRDYVSKQAARMVTQLPPVAKTVNVIGQLLSHRVETTRPKSTGTPQSGFPDFT